MMEQMGERQGGPKGYPEQFHDPSTNNPYQQSPQYQPQQYQQPPQQQPPQQYQQPPQQQPLADPNELLNQIAGAQPQYQQQVQPQFQDPSRPVGRNKDADQIANTSDMYFAQLKLDSKIRKRAFLTGDYDTSNKVFDDERVQNLPDELQKNPFIRAVTEQSKRNKDADLATSEDEALPTTLMYTTAELNKPKYSPGLNYREKLKARQGGLPNTVAPKVPPPPRVEPVIEKPEPVIEQKQEVAPPSQAQQTPPPPQVQQTTPPPQVQQTPPPPQPVYQQPPPQMQPQMQSPQQTQPPQMQPPQQQPQQIAYSNDPYEMLNQLAGEPTNQQQIQPQFQDPNRPVGRNKDADQIANTSDMYFAQLKLDSKLRKRAFLDGDYDNSNKVFEDERVQTLPTELQKNPFIRAVTDQSKRNNDLTTSEDETLASLMYTNADINKPKRASGLNYREKLKSRKQDSGMPSAVTPPPVVTPPPAAVTPPPVVTPPPAVVTPPEAAPVASVTDDYDTESRGKMRLLQGLLLKHKGGPGFGAGRLKAPDEKRFRETANDVISMLKSEAACPHIATPEPAVSVPVTVAPAAPAVDTNPLALAQQALQEAMQKCQDPSLSDAEKSQILLSAQQALQEAASKLAGGVPAAPQAAPVAPAPVAPAPVENFSTKHDDLLKDALGKLKDASGDAKFGLKQSLEKEKAQELMDVLPQMRDALLEELDMSISPAKPVVEEKKPMINPEIPKFDSSTDPNPSGGTKFQQMMERAKGAKQN